MVCVFPVLYTVSSMGKLKSVGVSSNINPDFPITSYITLEDIYFTLLN